MHADQLHGPAVVGAVGDHCPDRTQRVGDSEVLHELCLGHAVEYEVVLPGDEVEDAVGTIARSALSEVIFVVHERFRRGVVAHVVAGTTRDIDMNGPDLLGDEDVVGAGAAVNSEVAVTMQLHGVGARAAEVDHAVARVLDRDVDGDVHIDRERLPAGADGQLSVLHVGVGVVDRHNSTLLVTKTLERVRLVAPDTGPCPYRKRYNLSDYRRLFSFGAASCDQRHKMSFYACSFGAGTLRRVKAVLRARESQMRFLASAIIKEVERREKRKPK